MYTGLAQPAERDPRERLVETAVAKLAVVSRTPVREALHRLEVDGLGLRDVPGRERHGGLHVRK